MALQTAITDEARALLICPDKKIAVDRILEMGKSGWFGVSPLPLGPAESDC
jgi:hypothetical protein